MEESASYNPREVAVQQLVDAASRIDVSDSIVEKLKHPKRILQVHPHQDG